MKEIHEFKVVFNSFALVNLAQSDSYGFHAIIRLGRRYLRNKLIADVTEFEIDLEDFDQILLFYSHLISRYVCGPDTRTFSKLLKNKKKKTCSKLQFERAYAFSC